jgi:type I restriction enzyme M protein
MNNFNDKVNFIWSVADLLRGPYRPNQYKDVMLPMVVLRRLDCVLEPSKQAVLDKMKALQGSKIENLERILNREAGQNFHNTSRFTFEKLKGDSTHIADNLLQYIKSFSPRALDILEHFQFEEQIFKLDKADRLYLLVSKFAEIDLHPDAVSNLEMGYIFEELIRRFNEASNEEAGDHFTPREVIRLMVNLIFAPDGEILTRKGIVKTLFDPAAGTGGMLSVSEEYLRELNPDARLEVFGQDYNDQSYAICGSDMMIKGQSMENIRRGDSLTDDKHQGKHFDYMLANPPFGVEWKPEEKDVRKEYQEQGFGGRFGAGLPRINDGSFLFLQHMISKMKRPEEGGTRLAIVFNGSPLFTGGAGSGESEIRKWIIEHDWLDAIIAMPDQMFYNTGISTYLWIVTNRKEAHRKGKIQLINASTDEFFQKMRKSLGNKRHEITPDQIDAITKLYGECTEGEHVKIFPNEAFGYQRITVERPLKLNFQVNEERLEKVQVAKPFQALATSKKRKDTAAAAAEIEAGREQQKLLIKELMALECLGLVKNRSVFVKEIKQAIQASSLKIAAPLMKAILSALSERDETAEICRNAKGNPEPDTELRDYENVPLDETIEAYMKREVLPHIPDAWVVHSKTKIGYETNFNRYFYKYEPPRSVVDIEKELQQIEHDIAQMILGLEK